MQKTITLDADFVKEISDAHASYQSQNDILTSLINQHITDQTDVFVESQVYKTLSSRCAEALQKFEGLKASVEPKFIPREPGYVAKDWNLDYQTGQLTVNYMEAK